MTAIPNTQYAVQLVGPDELKLNTSKPVDLPTKHHILLKIEAVGLCFSDLKLLHQFSEHPRKLNIQDGIATDILAELTSYVPGEQPTVPGHEACVRVVAVGSKVTEHKVGDRYLVQADWRQMVTAASNGAFGYCFEGGLQEYVIVDERIVIDEETGSHFLIPAAEDFSASAIALIEPWGCVECSYVTPERNTIKHDGKLLVVAEAGRTVESLDDCYDAAGRPAEITAIYGTKEQAESFTFQETGGVFHEPEPIDAIASLPDETYDDIVYFGARAKVIEALNSKLARGGIINIVLGGAKIGQLVNVGVGRTHYGLTRWIGTTTDNAAESYKVIPNDGEIRANDKVVVIGAGGPMGQMHVIRNLCSGIEGVEIIGTDFDDERLESLRSKAEPISQSKGLKFRLVNPQTTPLTDAFDYYALMAPLGVLVADAIQTGATGAMINIFAGIPATTNHDLDLDTYISKGMFMFGTSGSTIDDILIVRDKVESAQLDTDCSVDAVSGMAGALAGIDAVKDRTCGGKIVVYPQLHDMEMISLKDIGEKYPNVAAKLSHGMWTKQAEKQLLIDAVK
ncbi:MAG: alcohol dehydrogenase catalytic domain-containing protein [Phycisphaerae bacterium]|nr:alcohol dehydrogenase catalytic domain-containing protein [Phycisphaerae bacterium]